MEETEFRCPHIETCPNVLQACERKVKAESRIAVLEGKIAAYEEDIASYSEKRPLMNELYSAGLAMRKAQKKYFSERSKEALIASRVAEKRFDEALAACQKAK